MVFDGGGTRPRVANDPITKDGREEEEGCCSGVCSSSFCFNLLYDNLIMQHALDVAIGSYGHATTKGNFKLNREIYLRASQNLNDALFENGALRQKFNNFKV